MASATQRALAARATRAANLIDHWCKHISEELGRQCARNPKPGETVTLDARKMDAMLSFMLPLADEIHSLERNLTKAQIRARQR